MSFSYIILNTSTFWMVNHRENIQKENINTLLFYLLAGIHNIIGAISSYFLNKWFGIYNGGQ